ncbi:MAG: flagellar hook-associated protein FlgL [Azonexus sp.]|jgi:flagellar hook-associated protein 3 FlgL|nr:flagellar hook-associated protein FlgL [Azonexus sp.]
MRVSTAQIFNSGTIGMQNRTSDMYKLQQQMSSGKKILSPQDDPIGASEALKTTQAQNVNTQFIDNIKNANGKLNFADSTLSSIQDVLQSIHESAVNAGNGTYDDSQRGQIAAQLKQQLQSLIDLANTQDGTGKFIFAGYSTSTQPFTLNAAATPPYSLATGSYVSYNGDAGVEALQVSGSRVMATSENGLATFMQVRDAQGNPTGRSMFDSVQNLIDNLSSNAFNVADYQQSLTDTLSMLDHTGVVRASLGGRMNALDSMQTAGEDYDLLYSNRLSDLQDLDYIDAASKMSQLQMQLEAAQLSFKTISQLSLFNVI